MSKIKLIKQQQLEAAQSGQVADIAAASTPARKIQAAKAQELETGTQYAARDPQETGSAPAPAAPQSLEHYQAALSADLATLAGLNTLADKAKAKAGMIIKYWEFVTQYLQNGDHYPNDVAVRVCIWLFDILNIERGLDLAFVLIKQNQATPAKFDRDLPTFVCDAVYDWANALLKKDESASPYLDALVATLDNDQWSLSPPVQSKMYVMLAKHKKRTDDWLNVLALCEKAEQINPDGAGVKLLKQEAQKKLSLLTRPANNDSSKPRLAITTRNRYPSWI